MAVTEIDNLSYKPVSVSAVRFFVVAEPLIEKLVEYLQTRPYKEVFELIDALKALEPMYAMPYTTKEPETLTSTNDSEEANEQS